MASNERHVGPTMETVPWGSAALIRRGGGAEKAETVRFGRPNQGVYPCFFGLDRWGWVADHGVYPTNVSSPMLVGQSRYPRATSHSSMADLLSFGV